MTADTESSGLFARLKKTRASLAGGLSGLFGGGRVHFDDDVYDDLEDQLLMADLGVEASTSVVSALRERVRTTRIDSSESLKEALIDELSSILTPAERPLAAQRGANGPLVILMVGVNGVGKTTTTAKLAAYFQKSGRFERCQKPGHRGTDH